MEYSKENKSQWKHITSIFKDYTTPSRVLRSLTNLSNTVIQTALSGQSKFVFEILQNADDAFEDEFKAIEVQFILQNNYLIVHHNGKGFNFNDVERICDYASQIEEVKATDLSKTGYKGLGFKSLFNLSDCIYIYSNGYSFRFDKTYWPDSQSKPWQIIPIWCSCDELPLNEKYSYDQPVNFILQVNDVSQIESQLKELVDQPELFLYLNRINKLGISLNGQKYSLERKVENLDIFNKVDFYKNQLLASTWLSRTYKLSVPTEVQTFVQGASRFVYPNKIQKAKEATFTFTVHCDQAIKEISKINGLCYSTLPTQLHLAFPYHINSLFILNLDRTQLHENEWNEFLIYEIGHLQLSLLKDLAGMIYLKNYVVELLVRNIDHPYATFSKAFLKGFTEGKSEIGWLPAHQGSRLLKLGEAWTDETDFFKHNFQNIRDHKIYPYLINNDVRRQHDLSFSEGEAKHFTYDQLFRDFPSKYYPQLTKGSYINFITYLYERLKGFSAKSTVMVKLKDVPFLIAKDGTLLSPRNASLEESENPVPDFLMVTLVDNEYLPSNNIHLIKEWLELLGARWLKTPIQIIRESILEWINSGQLGRRITMKNHIGIINYLAKNADQLTKQETEKLKERLLVLTEGNKFKPAKFCYLPDAVSIKELSDAISNDEKISSCYDMDSLRGFFIHIGVHDVVNPIDILRKSILMWIKNGEINHKLTKNNYNSIIEFVASHYLTMECNLTASEKGELKKIPILTCGECFQKAEVCYLDSAILNIQGIENIIAKDKLISTENTSENVINFLEKIGVSKDIAPVDVIRGSILRWITNGEINDELTKSNYNLIIDFVALHYFTIEHNLTASEKEEFKKIPVLTCSELFRKAEVCYLDSAIPDIKGFENIIAKNELVSTKNASEYVINFLKKIGVSKKIAPLDVIRRSILRWITNGEINNELTKSNYNSIIEFVASHYPTIEYDLTPSEKTQLKQKPVLTCDELFQEAEVCYLDSALLDINGFECIIAKNELVSTKNASEYVINFLQKIGVSKNIAPLDVMRRSIFRWITNGKIDDELTKSNYNSIIEFVASHYSTIERDFPEAEKIELKQMPVLTCDELFQKAEVCYMDTAVLDIKGFEYIIAKNELVSSENTSKDVINFLIKVGVSKEIAPLDVIKRSVLRWILDGNIEEKITIDNHHDILNYIAKQWVTFRNLWGLKPEVKQNLKQIPILTKNDTFREVCSCYFPASNSIDNNYDEIPGLEYIIPSDEHVSSVYRSMEIQMLLKDLGVRNLSFINIYEKYSDHLTRRENVKWFFSILIRYWESSSSEKNELLTYLQQKLNSSSRLLAKNGEMYFSAELYSSRFYIIHNIDSNAIPLLDFPKLPEDLERYLGFKMDLDLNCIMQLIEAIRKKPELGEKDTHSFFTILLEQLRNKDKNEIKKYKLSLLSKDNELRAAKDLHYFIEEDATCVLDSCYLKRIHGMSQVETLRLAELCGVSTIPFEQKVDREKEIYDNTLQEFYLERLPLIVVQESKELNESPSITLKRLYDEVCTIKLYQCHNIHVKYPFGNSVEIRNHFDGLTLYVVGKWATWEFKSDIHSHIRKQLCFKTDIAKIIDMEPITQYDKQAWLNYKRENQQKFSLIEEELQKLLSNQGKIFASTPCENANVDQHHLFKDEEKHFIGNEFSENEELISSESSTGESSNESVDEFCLETEYTNKNEPETIASYKKINDLWDEGITEANRKCLVPNKSDIGRKKRIHQPEMHGIHYSSTKSLRTKSYKFPQKVSDKKPHIKRLSEKYVLNFLQEHYKKKYPNSQFNLLGGLFKIQWQSDKIEIVWLNESEEKGHPYDLLLNRGSTKQHFEVKSSNDELTASESSSHKSSKESVDEFCLETQYAIKNEPETITSYKTMMTGITINDSWDGGITELDRKCLVPNKSDIGRKRRINQPRIHGIHYSSTKCFHTESYKFSQEVSYKKPHIKRLSERCVFDFLQEHYKKKYPNSQFNLLCGLFKLQWQSHEIEIVWLNENEDKGHPYDLLLNEDGEIKQVIEVKSSNDVANEDSFNMSRNEFIKNMNQLTTELPQHTEKYCIYRVFNAENPLVGSVEGLNIPSLFKIVPLKNPDI